MSTNILSSKGLCSKFTVRVAVAIVLGGFTAGPPPLAHAQQRPTEREAPQLLDNFPQRTYAEAVRGDTVKLSGSFVFYLPAGDTLYVPLSSEHAEWLSSPPKISGSIGLTVISAEASCQPVIAMKTDGDSVYPLDGGKLKWGVVLVVRAEAPAGTQAIRISFPAIEKAQIQIAVAGGVNPAEPLLVVATLRVWASRAAKDEEKVRLRKEQTERQAAKDEEEARLQKEQAERQAALLTTALKRGVGVVLLGVVLFLFWRRLWPHVRVQILPGGHEQKREVARSIAADVGQPFGTLVETIWARDLRGNRHPIKVEYLAGISDSASVDDLREKAFRAYAPGEYRIEKPPRWAGGGAKLDVLVSAGACVRLGTYFAVGRHGAVMVKVV